jgi:tRNA modification GTPase
VSSISPIIYSCPARAAAYKHLVFTNRNQPDLEDTIVAVSSAPGPAARAIVRLSGRRGLSILATFCDASASAPMPPGEFVTTALRLAAFHSAVAADIYYYKAPRTYTGQDLVEIHLISCQPMVDALIAACLNAGARAAGPGEFTMRAFLAGKLDLTRAEAVFGVIEASDRHELAQALTQLAGGLETPLRSVRDNLLNLLADLEAGLDFADEDIHFVQSDELLRQLTHALGHLTIVKKQLRERTVNRRPFRVVLAGKPNAGKSSLFNALLGKNTALVDAEAGTTRDYLEGELVLDNCTVQILDTAGVGIPLGDIDASAQQLGQSESSHADFLLWCVAADDLGLQSPPTNALIVVTKSDLARSVPAQLKTSARSGEGIAALRSLLVEQSRRSPRSSLAPSVSRCAHHVEEGLQHLQHAHALVIEEGLPELVALQIRLAIESLGALVGAVFSNDLLDRIFSRFCIGK